MPRDEREDDSLVNKLCAFQSLTENELNQVGTLRLLERCRERDKCSHDEEWDVLKERVMDLLDPFRKMSSKDLWG